MINEIHTDLLPNLNYSHWICVGLPIHLCKNGDKSSLTVTGVYTLYEVNCNTILSVIADYSLN
jgi:hypothetical protein